MQLGTRILCIAGGSGTGKTTLAEGIIAKLGDQASLLHLDDYQKGKESVPLTASGRRNYDHPVAVDFERFCAALAELKRGRDVAVPIRRKRNSMEAGVADAGTYLVASRPLVIIEGYLALWHEAARACYDFSVFLDAPPELRVARRRWVKDPQYVDEVLLPMHEAFIEPTKRHADLVLDIAAITADEVLQRTMIALSINQLI